MRTEPSAERATFYERKRDYSQERFLWFFFFLIVSWRSFDLFVVEKEFALLAMHNLVRLVSVNGTTGISNSPFDGEFWPLVRTPSMPPEILKSPRKKYRIHSIASTYLDAKLARESAVSN